MGCIAQNNAEWNKTSIHAVRESDVETQRVNLGIITSAFLANGYLPRSIRADPLGFGAYSRSDHVGHQPTPPFSIIVTELPESKGLAKTHMHGGNVPASSPTHL